MVRIGQRLRFRKFNIKIMLVLMLLVVVLVFGVSYALWQIVFVQTDKNVLSSDCFKIEFSDTSPISLDNAYPITDDEGKKLLPYEFTLTNVCSSDANYQINLEILNDTTFSELQYIRQALNEKEEGVENQVIASLILDKEEVVEKTLDNATSAYKLKTGVLGANEVKTFQFRLWMDEDTPAIDSVMNKVLSSKITVITSYKVPVDTSNMMMERYTHPEQNNDEMGLTTDNYEFMSNSKHIIFRNSLVGVEKVEPVDVSFNQDKSVLAYVDNSNPDDVTTYIEANGKIKFPVNSALLFNGLSVITIDGLEFVDTSNVNFMDGMFQECSSLTALDLTTFDTGNVTSMICMFFGCSNLITLDLATFDTRNVAAMEGMFDGCGSLTSLDLTSFDTGNVTAMGIMFKECSSLTVLDLTSFDTRNVISMDSMLGECSSLITLDLTSFDTRNVTGMGSMFYNCSSLTTLDLTPFDTRNVISMDSMLGECSSLITLDLTSFDTRNVTSMVSMFYNCSSLTNIVYSDKFIHNYGADVGYMYSYCPANKPTHSSWNGVFL